jgi:hypothetical protein
MLADQFRPSAKNPLSRYGRGLRPSTVLKAITGTGNGSRYCFGIILLKQGQLFPCTRKVQGELIRARVNG